MRAAAGLAMTVLLAGCGGPDVPKAQSALRFSPDLAENFQALPRVALETPEAQAVNAALDRVDARDRESREDCLSMKPHNDNVEWGRTVDVAMSGPRFVSIVMTRGEYCGGAHPNWDRPALVFDLQTGRLIDWRAFLPAGMTAEMHDDDADEWVSAAYLKSPELKAWFAARAMAAMDEYGRKECADIYGQGGHDEWGLTIWPDAKAAGLILQSAGLAHAEKGCFTEVTMSLRELKRRGVRRELTDALEVAHRSHLWRDGYREPEEGR